MPASPTDGLQLQDRDLAVLRGLFECRVMTARHVTTLYFDGKGEYTKKRLRQLKAAGLVGERKRRVNEASVLFLTRKGFRVLGQQVDLSRYPPLSVNAFEARANVSDLTLQHELAVMDVKAAFHVAVRKAPELTMIEFSTWPALHQFELPRAGSRQDVPVKPDGFIRIGEHGECPDGFHYDCFLEVDRSSKDHDRLTQQAARYRDYYSSGGFAVRNGADRSQKDKFPFRVLMVFKSAERLNNSAERLLQILPPILTMAWLTTMAEVTNDPLGAIWIRPAEYREATSGTSFDVERRLPTGVYRRQPEREAFVERTIKKLRLLEG